MSYEGQAIPVELRRIIAIPAQPGGTGYSCSDRLTAMNLRFVGDASVTQTEFRLLVCDDGRPDASSTFVSEGTYDITGQTLLLTLDLGSGVSEILSARVAGVALTVYQREVHQDGGPTSFTYAPLEFVATP